MAEWLAHHGSAYLLVVFRLGGLLVFSPLLSSAAVPGAARVLLVAALAAAMFPVVPPVFWGAGREAGLDLLTLLLAVMGEVALGALLGLMASLPIMGVQLAGHLAGLQMGFGLSGVYNPMMESESDILGELLAYVAIGVFLSMGGLEAMFVGVASTFASLPAGGFVASMSPRELFVGLLSSAVALGVCVSAPVMCVIVIETVASALIMKTMPQINIMSIGFAAKIMLGLGMLAVSIFALREAMGAEVEHGLREVVRWAAGLGARVGEGAGRG
ncbi:MAG: flagellar biosynthetic protein FliR [Phycisphaerae bacterium]|nr:flagellar biosynthetic protein FliR [Phycisphaerae bacterium]